MKRKLAFLAVVLGLTFAASWTTPAEALPPYCETRCKPTTSPTYPCTCIDTLQVTTCGQWQSVCL